MAKTQTLELTLDARDVVRAAEAFKKFPHGLQKATEFATIQSLAIAVRHLAIYPPPRAGQTYRRTGTLKRRWRFLKGNVSGSPRKVRGSVWNVTPYAQWVQDEQRQAWMHRGRWNTVQTVIRGPFLRLYIRFFQKAILRVTENILKTRR